MLPLCTLIPTMLPIFTFMAAWNDFMWPLIVLNDNDMYTLPVALANMLGEYHQQTELMLAGAVITVLPVMIVFAVLQRYYLEGIMLGSIKG